MRRAALAFLLVACTGPEPTPGGPFLEDVAGAVGLAFERAPLSDYDDITDRLGGGVCVLDVDGLPPLDLFFAMRGDSRLYLGGDVYRDETEMRGLGDVGDALGCLAYDVDGDGDDDLVVTGLGTLRLFLADGGLFVDASDTLGATVGANDLMTSAAAGDIDGDGDLDLAVAGFVDAASLMTGDCLGVPCALMLPRADPIANLLLERVDGGFQDVTLDRAPAMTELEATFVVGFPDLDEDGIPELYIGNDFGFLYDDRVLARDAGGLVDVSERLGFAYDSSGNGIDTMGWTIGDVDLDGRFDMAVTTFEGMHSPVFLCEFAGEFCEDRGRQIGTVATEDTFRWANALFDVDLDGDDDLIEAAGHLYLTEEGATVGIELIHEQPLNILLNEGGLLTRVIPDSSDAASIPLAGRGMAIVDLDDDGRLDIVIATARGARGVFRNVRPTEGHYLRVRLEGQPPNTGGVGALLTVDDGSRVRRRQRLAGEGFLGNFDPRLHVGLPTSAPVRVEVRWPDGTITTVEDVAVDAEITVRQGS